MEFFHKAKAVRLRSHHDKYLLADEDEESVCQDRNGSSKSTRWTVEFINGENVIRLKSCYGKYLTASNLPFLLGMTGRKVLQTLPRRLDSSLEWEPVRDGFHCKFKTRYRNYLRANGGMPPWRNSVTHDIPYRSVSQDLLLWEVDIVEIQEYWSDDSLRKMGSVTAESQDASDYSSSKNPSKLSKLESSDSFILDSPLKKNDGRTIFYKIADDYGSIDKALEEPLLMFKGTSVDELTHKLEEETGLIDLIVCSHNPLNGQLYPLRLQLPPNNTDMHVVLVKSSSKVAKDLQD